MARERKTQLINWTSRAIGEWVKGVVDCGGGGEADCPISIPHSDLE